MSINTSRDYVIIIRLNGVMFTIFLVGGVLLDYFQCIKKRSVVA